MTESATATERARGQGSESRPNTPLNRRKRRLERAALVAGILVLLGGAWFWTLQVLEVLEVLALAYG